MMEECFFDFAYVRDELVHSHSSVRMPSCRDHPPGAGGQGAGCAQVVGGGASRPPANQRRGVGGQTLQTANQRREENIFFQENIFPENRLRDHINKY